jgi:hypothetical protein
MFVLLFPRHDACHAANDEKDLDDRDVGCCVYQFGSRERELREREKIHITMTSQNTSASGLVR